MTKNVKDRLDQQLAEIQHLIAEIDEVSARLKRAADAAIETHLNARTPNQNQKEAPDDHDPV